MSVRAGLGGLCGVGRGVSCERACICEVAVLVFSAPVALAFFRGSHDMCGIQRET